MPANTSTKIYNALFQVMDKALEGKQDVEQGRLVLNSATRATELFQAELRQKKLQIECGQEVTNIGATKFGDEQ